MLITTHKKWPAVVLLGMVLMASSCKKDKEPPPSPTQDLNTTIKELENKGALPKLDRSNDLVGPDNDGNGVRDDIDAYIAKLRITQPQKKH